MFDTFGNKVRIIKTSETIEAGLADKTGEVLGQTTPSQMEIDVIGKLEKDFAVNVYFQDTRKSFWFSEDLIEYLDSGEGVEISINGVDKKWTKGPNGEWNEEEISQNFSEIKKPWWKIW